MRTGSKRLPSVMMGSPSGTSAQRFNQGSNMQPSLALMFTGLDADFEKLFDIAHLLVPATAVHSERLEPARLGNVIKTGLGNLQQRTVIHVFELEQHQCGGLQIGRASCRERV